ncbi:BTAD domain-containing putative transcriptional regulator [Micromonospora sp. NPDC000663]|uniref:AfsR/SARP family transcriptional regulator n=1 Tax=Micromonospora sp. NPDC000663 TaxID=3364218 RepID=UPI0036A6B737
MSDGRLLVQGIGPLRAYVDGEEIEIGPPKQRAAFAVLALCAGTTVSRGELIERVWGEAAPATAAGSLHTYVSGLRRALGPAKDALVSDRAGYCLRLDRTMFDAIRAKDLADRARAARGTPNAPAAYERALEAWTVGTLCTGVPGPFVALARDRFAELRLQLLIEYAEITGPRGLPDVVSRLLLEVPAHPFDERLRTVLMRALHGSGRTADALAQYENLRSGLAAELGISPSLAIQEVYAEILADERRRAGEPPPGAPPPGEPVRPAQLPSDNDAFVGRTAELLTVMQCAGGVTESRRRIVGIVGVGGIGKTALAVRAGHLLRDQYPDGQIYLNLRGFDPSHAALTPDAALHQLLTSVGARHIPSGREDRIVLWRSLVADKRMLLVLDNAKSDDQIEDLLPGGNTCFVIVTSRNRLSRLVVRHAARRIQLGALNDQESLSLLTTAIGEDRVRAEPESAHRLMALCDRSPFALQIAAERVVSTRGTRIGDLVGQLEDVRQRLDGLQLDDDPLCSVRGVLSWSFAALSDDAAWAFRLLGVFPGASVTRYIASALFGVPVERAEILLGKLSALCLLEQENDRFTLHDLTRVYAAELSGDLEPGERRDALSRVLSWYRVTLSGWSGNGMFLRGTPVEPPHSDVPPVVFHGQQDCLRWCEAERPNIVALVRAAQREGQHGAAWHLACLVFDYFYVAGQPLEWLDLLRVAMRSAEAAGNHVARAILFNHRGVAYSRLGQNEIAVRQLNRGLELLGHPDDWRYRISLLGNLASTMREAKEYEAARGPAREALALARREGIDYYLAATHDVLCELNAETGRWEEAMRDGLPGLEYARRSRSRILEANLLINIGLAQHGLGRQGAAEESFGEALRISRDVGDLYHEGLALFGLARASARGGVVEHGVRAEVVADLARRALAPLEQLHAEEVVEVRAFLAALDV